MLKSRTVGPIMVLIIVTEICNEETVREMHIRAAGGNVLVRLPCRRRRRFPRVSSATRGADAAAARRICDRRPPGCRDDRRRRRSRFERISPNSGRHRKRRRRR